MSKQGKKLKSPTLALIFAAAIFWMLVVYQIPSTIEIVALRFVRPISTSFMRYKSLRHPFKRISYQWVGYDEISNYLKQAVIIAEDDRFFEHGGLDWRAIKNAAKVNWKRKEFHFGASTITQQVAKNLFLTPSKDPIRKFREAVLAVMLDAYLPKQRILELYLNIAQWGPNVYGAGAAAKYYFGTSVKNLRPSQAAFLASILPNPVKLGRNGYRLSSRAQSILNRIY